MTMQAPKLDVALKSVAALKKLDYKDEQPDIEGATLSLVYEMEVDTNYQDCHFLTKSSVLQEAQYISALNDIIKDGHEFASVTYTMRSTAKALGAFSQGQADPSAITLATKEILEPLINKLLDLKKYCEDAIAKFIEIIVFSSKSGHASDTLLLHMANFLDIFAVLDALKNMKMLLNVDYSLFKRFNRADMAAGGDQTFYTWLANHNALLFALKAKLIEKDGFEEPMSEIVNLCSDYYESQQYVTPKEKHSLLKAMAFGLFLLDVPASKKKKEKTPNVFKLKTINILRVNRIFKTSPVVPLFGDMWMSLFPYLEMCPNYALSAPIELKEKDKLAGPSLVNYLGQARVEHDQLVADLAIEMTLNKNGVDFKDINYDLLKGMKVISGWTSLLQEAFSWKLCHPTTDENLPEGVEHYEKAVRYNFTSEEKYALIEFIAMIKGATAKLISYGSTVGLAIRSKIHREVQIFVQLTLRDLIRTVMKKKKKGGTADILKEVRAILAHWKDGKEPNDPAMRGEKDGKERFAPVILRAAVATSSSQLYVARGLLEPIYKSFKSGIMKSNDFTHEQVKDMENFVKQSYFYEHLLNYNTTLLECSDLSQFWFREHFLELTRGSWIQFPIAMSLPWILTGQILEKQIHPVMEYVFYPLDLYNDSANYSLRVLKCEYLYNEIEAEANLSFDQLIFKLAHQIHHSFKQTASSIVLDKGLRRDLLNCGIKGASITAQGNRYASILRQRHIQLLGRNIDLNKLLTERFNVQIRHTIDIAIGRYESGSFGEGILELELLLEQIKMTHTLLSEHVELDPFSQMLDEVNETISAHSFNSRIIQHTFYDIAVDFLPNYCYNSTTRRFYITKLPFTTAPDQHLKGVGSILGSKGFGEAFAYMREIHRGLISQQHLSALVRLVGRGQISVLIEELLQNNKDLITSSLMPFVTELMKGLPPNTKLPTYELGSQGAFMVFQLSLNPIITYRDLKPIVFHHFRELGNSLIFIHLLEQAMNMDQGLETLIATPVTGTTATKEPSSAQEKKKMPLFVDMINEFGDIGGVTKENVHSLHKENKQGSIFKNVLLDLQKNILQLTDWKSPYPRNGVMEVDGFPEFYRFWSAIQYAYCTPSMNPKEFTMDAVFGDGVLWGGLAIVRLLEQHYRFNAFDFSYHIMKVNDYDNSTESCNGIDLVSFVENVKTMKIRNDSIFYLFDKVLDVAHGKQVFHPLVVTDDDKIQQVKPTTDNPTIATPTESDPPKNLPNIAPDNKTTQETATK